MNQGDKFTRKEMQTTERGFTETCRQTEKKQGGNI